MVLRTHDGRTRSRLPARSTCHEQEDQNQRKSAFERLRPSGSHNRESRQDHSQNYQVEQPRKTRSKVPIQIAPQNYSHQDNSWQEGGADNSWRISPVLQTDLLQYDCLTSSSRPTTLSMMARPSQGSGSGFTHNRLNYPEETMISRPCSFLWP